MSVDFVNGVRAFDIGLKDNVFSVAIEEEGKGGLEALLRERVMKTPCAYLKSLNAEWFVDLKPTDPILLQVFYSRNAGQETDTPQKSVMEVVRDRPVITIRKAVTHALTDGNKFLERDREQAIGFVLRPDDGLGLLHYYGGATDQEITNTFVAAIQSPTALIRHLDDLLKDHAADNKTYVVAEANQGLGTRLPADANGLSTVKVRLKKSDSLPGFSLTISLVESTNKDGAGTAVNVNCLLIGGTFEMNGDGTGELDVDQGTSVIWPDDPTPIPDPKPIPRPITG